MRVRSASILLALFAFQLGISFVFQHDEARTIVCLTGSAWIYRGMAAALFLFDRERLARYLDVGLLGRDANRVTR